MSSYEQIKELAKQQGLRVQDLLALAPKNDPFYTGRPAELEAAYWFQSVWQRFGYNRVGGIHLRRVHYQLVSQEPRVPLPQSTAERMQEHDPDFDGTYHNTLNCWRYLNNASKYARYLGLVDASLFVDRRNKDPIIDNTDWKNDGDYNFEDPKPGFDARGGQDWEYLGLPNLPRLANLGWGTPAAPKARATGYESIQQDYHVEVWAEKSTMDDVLAPVCENHGVNLVRGAGELSITMVLDFMERVRAAKRPARIGYVADFDPAGLGMPISVARKVEYFQRQFGYGDLDIRLEPLVLTLEQVRKYRLPRVPVKDTDARKAGFELAYGEGQVELDALEALHEGQLADILADWLRRYVDLELVDRAEEAKQELQDELDEKVEELLDEENGSETAWLRSHIMQAFEELQDDWKETQKAWAEHAKLFQENVDAHKERLEEIQRWGEACDKELKRQIADFDIDFDWDHPLPKPDLEWEGDEQLYISELSYGEQLFRYQAWRHNL